MLRRTVGHRIEVTFGPEEVRRILDRVDYSEVFVRGLARLVLSGQCTGLRDCLEATTVDGLTWDQDLGVVQLHLSRPASLRLGARGPDTDNR